MKKFWFKLAKWDKKVITTAIESGFETFYVPKQDINKIKERAVVKVICDDKRANLVLGKDVAEILICSKADEKKVEAFKGKIPVIISNKDWTIIPLENLISKTSNLIQLVKNAKQAEIALTTLEVGADGIILATTKLNEIKKTGDLMIKSENEKLSLIEAEIINLKPVGLGDRVIVDTSTFLKEGQGMLIGNSSEAMFLVYNENVKNPFCDPRPFRVNAGGVHAYVRLPKDKTCYLSELKTGMKALVVDHQGNTQEVVVGRVKIERRPMVIIEAKINNKLINLIMQNAETIRLTGPKGNHQSITKLKKGDKVLVFLQEKGCGRHFGQKIKETIIEN